MLTKNEVEGFKKIMPLFINSMPGMGFSFTNRETITDLYFHPDLKIDAFFKVGMRIDAWGDRGSAKAVRTGEMQTEMLVTVVFGARLLMQNIPFVDEDGEIAGTVCLVSIRKHTITNAFPDFAPMIAEMFPEGAGLYMTDAEKIVNKQGSSKFDLDIKVGQIMDKSSVAMQSISNKKITSRNIDKSVYGVPILSVSYPLFDDVDKNQVIGSFGITLPQATSHSLQSISGSLNQNLSEIAAVIEELAASASEMMSNQQSLNQNVAEVSTFVVNINEILTLIRQIADETKMLGLNAAIEAARAGEAGAGFSVVASEIRKLSDESKDTVAKIRNLTTNIENKVQQTIKNSELNMRSSEEQAAATQEVSASIQELSSMAVSLADLARKLN